MTKWKDISKHWSKTDKRKEVLEKVKKTLRSDNWTGKHRDRNTIRALNDGRTRWIEENPDKYRKSRIKAAQKITGDRNSNWGGGKEKWLKKQVNIRDDYTCQVCGLRDMEIIEIDHIFPKSKYPELKFDMNNLMTLCPNCHRRKTLRELKHNFYK